MARQKKAQEYSPEEFDSVVALIQHDQQLREDIEAITGKKLAGKTPRELFDLFLTLKRATEAQATVVRYGQARHAVRATRRMLASDEFEDRGPYDLSVRRISDLEAKVDELKASNRRLREANRALTAGKPVGVIRGEVTA